MAYTVNKTDKAFVIAKNPNEMLSQNNRTTFKVTRLGKSYVINPCCKPANTFNIVTPPVMYFRCQTRRFSRPALAPLSTLTHTPSFSYAFLVFSLQKNSYCSSNTPHHFAHLLLHMLSCPPV